MNLGIDVETQVVVILSKLSLGNTLRMCGETYGIVEPTTSGFCATLSSHEG